MKNLKVVDPTASTLTARWDPAVGNVRSYKVLYAAQPGGEQQMVKGVQVLFIFWDEQMMNASDGVSQEEVSGGTTSTILRNLESDTLYSVAVVPVYPDVEGVRQEEKGKTSE